MIQTFDNEVEIKFSCMTDKFDHLTREKIKEKLMPLFDHITEQGFVDIHQDVGISLEVAKSEE